MRCAVDFGMPSLGVVDFSRCKESRMKSRLGDVGLAAADDDGRTSPAYCSLTGSAGCKCRDCEPCWEVLLDFSRIGEFESSVEVSMGSGCI